MDSKTYIGIGVEILAALMTQLPEPYNYIFGGAALVIGLAFILVGCFGKAEKRALSFTLRGKDAIDYVHKHTVFGHNALSRDHLLDAIEYAQEEGRLHFGIIFPHTIVDAREWFNKPKFQIDRASGEMYFNPDGAFGHEVFFDIDELNKIFTKA